MVRPRSDVSQVIPGTRPLGGFIGKHWSLVAVVAITTLVALSFLSPYHSGTATYRGGATDSGVVPAQALINFLSCTLSDGTSCLNGEGGLTGDLDVGTVLSVDIETSVLSCGNSVTAYVDWGDGTQTQYISGPPGAIGPFTHTFDLAGSFNLGYGDSCDGASPDIPITVTGGGLEAFSAAFGLLGLFLGLVGLGLVFASFRTVKPSNIPQPQQTPTTFTTGSVIGTPTGPAGVTSSTSMNVPAGNAPPGGWPPWALDLRTTPFTPNLYITGWSTLLQNFQTSLKGQPPRPPAWPAPQTEPNPPTNYPGVFYQARVNPQTGKLAWWNPVDGSFPWG
jgi:hypothetical protein